MFPPGSWYEALQKPVWIPPNWAFPVAWSILYLLMAASGALTAASDGNAYAMAFWALQIAVNALWSPIFFGLRRIKAGMLVVVILWLSVFGAMVSAFAVNTLAGWLLAPYLLWVTIAAALNASVWRLNPGEAANPSAP